MKHFIIGTAGHIDHGKTSLVKALTGRNTDRLAEEQKRGITIDLGFTYYDDPSGVRIGIVDVPGHEKFVKNMLSGVHGMDMVLVIIAADEGIMPQTKEHINILELLGVKNGIIVISKSDMVEQDWLELVRTDVRDSLKGTFLGNAPMVTVSSKTMDGIDELKKIISDEAGKIPENESDEAGVLPVDRIFVLKGVGTVVTGTQVHGHFSLGEEVEIYPYDILSKIRSIQVHGENVKDSYSSQRVAINLANVKKEDISRGAVISKPRTLLHSNLIDVKLKLLEDSPFSLKNRSRVRFHVASKETLARVILLDRDELLPGEETYAQIKLDDEVVAMRKDKFIIRFYSPVITIGGGEILEVKPDKKKRFKDESMELIKMKDAEDLTLTIKGVLKEHSDQLFDLNELSKSMSIPYEELRAYIEALEDKGEVDIIKDDYIILRANMIYMQKEINDYVKKYHDIYPLRTGVSVEEIRSRYLKKIHPSLQDTVLNRIISDTELTRDKDTISMSTFTRSYTDKEKKVIDEILDFMSKEDRTYRKDELIGSTGDLINSMIEDKLLIELAGEVMLYSYYLKATDIMISVIKNNGSINVKDFRDALETNRKTAIALLEYYDSKKITKRQGDERILMKKVV